MERLQHVFAVRNDWTRPTTCLFGALCWVAHCKVWLERRLCAYGAYLKHPELWSKHAALTKPSLGPLPPRENSQGASSRGLDSRVPATTVVPIKAAASPAATGSTGRSTSANAASAAAAAIAAATAEEHLSALQSALFQLQKAAGQ
mmetsp:Transcript_51825/g.168444  ORF Transcript_51825/g.168444 Transcript_51825/m.168444 type:complete len:146 (-) Transcript_51825:76-513(-)